MKNDIYLKLRKQINNYYNQDLIKKQIKEFNLLSKKHKFIAVNTQQEQIKMNETLYLM